MMAQEIGYAVVFQSKDEAVQALKAHDWQQLVWHIQTRYLREMISTRDDLSEQTKAELMELQRKIADEMQMRGLEFLP